MPTVSVIVPNYNHAPFLRQRIDSILNQTYQDFELIILDDCSTDNSKEMIEQYRNHPKVSQVVYNTENSGSTFKQWNKGIELAQGEYIWVAESDDWCEPTLLETLVPPLEMDKNVVIGYVQSYYIVDDITIKWVSSEASLEKIVDGHFFLKRHLLYSKPIFNASMAIFRKSVFYQIDNSYSNYKFCGDWFFWGVVATCGNVFISGKALNYFRNHAGDVSTKSYNTGLNYLEEIEVLQWFSNKRLINKSEFHSAINEKYRRFIWHKHLLPRENMRLCKEKFEYHIKKPVIYLLICENINKKCITLLKKWYRLIKKVFQ